MPEEEDIVVVTEKPENEEYKEKIAAHVSSLLWTGFIIGAIVCISICGLIQTLALLPEGDGPMYEFIVHVWLKMEWWYWLAPMAIALFVLNRIYKTRLARILSEKNGKTQ